jgi:hypothetical protein
MNRRHHQVLGATAGALYAQVSGLSLIPTLAATGVAALVAPLPDVDQRRWWKYLATYLPGADSVMKHRGITHWPGIAVVLTVVAVFLPVAQGIAWVVAAGYWSHLVGDFCIGARSRYRGPGIPFLCWRGHHGLGFHNTGIADQVITAMSALLTIYLLGT